MRKKDENNMQTFFSIILINKSYLNIYLSEESGDFFKEERKTLSVYLI